MKARAWWTGGGVPLLAFVAAVTLAGCSEEPQTPLDARLERSLAAVRLDPPAVVAALNAYRANHGLGPVRLDPALTAMAQRQADAMVAGNALSHDVAGSFRARLAASGVNAPEAGENLGAGYFSLEETMEGWRGSAEHDANLRMAGATRIGVAIAKSPRTHYGVYWALELAADPRPNVTTLRIGRF
jgi:uncharacterized protein YkwD